MNVGISFIFLFISLGVSTPQYQQANHPSFDISKDSLPLRYDSPMSPYASYYVYVPVSGTSANSANNPNANTNINSNSNVSATSRRNSHNNSNNNDNYNNNDSNNDDNNNNNNNENDDNNNNNKNSNISNYSSIIEVDGKMGKNLLN